MINHPHQIDHLLDELIANAKLLRVCEDEKLLEQLKAQQESLLEALMNTPQELDDLRHNYYERKRSLSTLSLLNSQQLQ